MMSNRSNRAISLKYQKCFLQKFEDLREYLIFNIVLLLLSTKWNTIDKYK